MNTALRGTKVALFCPVREGGSFARLRQRTEHLALNADQSFQETFVEEMAFPDRGVGDSGLGGGETPGSNPQNPAPRT